MGRGRMCFDGLERGRRRGRDEGRRKDGGEVKGMDSGAMAMAMEESRDTTVRIDCCSGGCQLSQRI